MLTFRAENKVPTKLKASLKMPDTILGSLSKVSILKNNYVCNIKEKNIAKILINI